MIRLCHCHFCGCAPLNLSVSLINKILSAITLMFHFRSSHEVQTLQISLLSILERRERSELSALFFVSNRKKLGRSGTIVISTPRSGFFEPGTSRTLSENYTPKPISLVSAKSQKHCAKYRQNRKLSRIGNAKCATLPVILIP